MPTTNHRMYTILFADIAGSTRLYDQLGDVKALALVAACMEKIQQVTESNQGKVVKTIGDEIMCMFPDPDQAVTAAIFMHEVMHEDPMMTAHQIRLRIGFHHGPTIFEVGDFYGDAVNVAARMVGQAKAGQIITTKTTVALMNQDRRDSARLLDQTRVKGKQEILEIYEIAWGQIEELTMISTRVTDKMGSEDGLSACMVIHYKDKQFTLNPQKPVITIGRESNNQLVVSDPRVSRLHARIELRRDKFVLVDQSTNGTFLLPGDGEIMMMRRDEIVLPRKGIITFGQKVDPDSPLAIRFQIF